MAVIFSEIVVLFTELVLIFLPVTISSFFFFISIPACSLPHGGGYNPFHSRLSDSNMKAGEEANTNYENDSSEVSKMEF